MPELDEMFEETELRKRVKLAKKQPMNFAFNKGKKPDEHLLALDKRKAPKILQKICKLQGTGSKVAFGTATAEGKDIFFTCEKELPGMRKAVTLLLKDVNLPMKVHLLGPDGQPIAEDDDDEAGAEAAPGVREKSAEEEAWEKRHEKLRLAAAKILKAKKGDGDKIRAVLGFAQEKAEGGDFAAAVKSLATLEKLLVAAAAGGKDKGPSGIVAKRKFLLTRWQKVPTDIKVEIGKLEQAIAVQVPDENPKELCGALDNALKELIADIQSAIDDGINAGDQGYASALKAIEQQKKVVQTHQIVQLLKSNPMIPGQQFEDAVITALDEVRDALAA